MGDNTVRRYYLPLNSAIEQRTRPGFDKDREAEWRQREADERFQKAIAVAIWRGDNLAAGQPKPVRPLVLTP